MRNKHMKSTKEDSKTSDSVLIKNKVMLKLYFSIMVTTIFIAIISFTNVNVKADAINSLDNDYSYYQSTLIQGSAIDDFFANYLYNSNPRNNITQSVPNTLEYNLVWNGNSLNDPNGDWLNTGGYWTDNYLNYNCYSFAIGKTDCFRRPGEDSGVYFGVLYYAIYTIREMAFFVENDLLTLRENDLSGMYDSINVWDFEPSIQAGQTLICMRRDRSDFHFMKYDSSSGYWYHKPGKTAPLRALFHPEDMVWLNEKSEEGVCYAHNELPNYEQHAYDSDIYYITYGDTIFTITSYDNTCTITGIESGVNIGGALSIPEDINGLTVTDIGANAFSNCTNITAVTIPKTINTIGHNAFEGCTSLETVIFRDNSTLISIDYQAFKGCTSLEKIVLPSSLTTLGNQVFYNCSNLEEAYIKNTTNVLSLGSSVFSYTSNDLVIYVPSSLYSSYYSSLYWTSYVNKLDKMYLDASGWYLEEYDYISMEGYIFLETLYNYNYTMDPNNDGFLIGDVGIVGEYLYYCYVHCYLDYCEENLIDCHLLIDVDGGTGCYLIDEDLEIITSCYITNYVLDVPLFDILNGGYEEFYLYPFENCNESFSFTDSDVTLEIMFKVYLDI